MKFRGQYCGFTKKTPLDYSNRFEQTFKELAPFARDEKGKFLNDSPYPVLVEGDKVDVQERINSFFEDVDLYSILRKVSLTGDLSYLDKKAGFYGDFSALPSNYNDINDYYKRLANDYKNLPADLKALISSDKPIDEIISKINELGKSQVVVDNVQNNLQDNKNNVESEIKDNENK